MNNRMILNLAAVLLAIGFISGIIWLNRPKVHQSLDEQAQNIAIGIAPSSPPPIPTPDPNRIQREKEYAEIVSRQAGRIRDELLPPVEELFKGNHERIQLYMEDPSWPYAQYHETFEGFSHERQPYRQILDDQYLLLEEHLLETQSALLNIILQFDLIKVQEIQGLPIQDHATIIKNLGEINSILKQLGYQKSNQINSNE